MNIKCEIKKLKKWQSFTLQEAKTFAENNNGFAYEEAMVYCKGKREMAQDAIKVINKLMKVVEMQRDTLEETDIAIGGYNWTICKEIRVVLEKSKQLLEGE